VTGTIYVTNEYDSNGERKKNEARVGFVLYGAEAVAFAQKAGKGDRVELEGRIRGNSWTDKTEQKRYSLELIANATKAAVLVKFVPKEMRTAA
jgi:single-stranded DNA-binding protein